MVVTRARAQAAGFVNALETLGAEVVSFPTIRIVEPLDPVPLRRAALRGHEFDWIVFTSTNGVERFWSELRAGGGDARSLGGASLCAIGPATAAALEAEGARADLVPAEHVGEAVVAALGSRMELGGARILLPRAELARPSLPERLRSRGAEVVEVTAYRTIAEDAGAGPLLQRLRSGELDVVTFTSGSAVRNFTSLAGTQLGRAKVASIGPTTSAAARDEGLAVEIEATTHTVAGLTTAIVAAIGR